MPSPKYSIIIPTRNRSHLLENAIRCALSQTFDDYEVIVSDNHSVDNTAAVAEKWKSDRLHYYRTPDDYAMPDSWEFALSKASGEWITFLTDDSGISSRLLEEVEAALLAHPVKAVSWSHLGRYYHASWRETASRNTLVYHPFGRSRIRMDAKPQLRKLYDLAADYTHPVGLNSFVHKDVIRQTKQKAGRFFFAPCPDYSSCAAVLSAVDEYVYIDLPLGINGIGKESIGMAQVTKRGESADNFVKEFKGEPLLKHVPLTTTVVANYITESLLRVKEAMPRDFESIGIDWGVYFFECWMQLGYLDRYGVNVDPERSELFAKLKEQPIAVRAKFFKRLFSNKFGLRKMASDLRNKMRQSIGRSKTLGALEKKVRKVPAFGGTVSGAEAGFSNLFEAARYLDTHILEG